MNWIDKQHLDFEKAFQNTQHLIMVKCRRSGMSTGFNNFMNSNYNPYSTERIHCKMLLSGLEEYVNVGYKKPFTSEEYNNIESLINTDDMYTIELAKQIILNKLNNE